MKISKIEHVRTSVSKIVKDEINIMNEMGGTLYYNPSLESKKCSVHAHVIERNKVAQNLYNVIAVEDGEEDVVRTIEKNFNYIIRWLVYKNKYSSNNQVIGKQLYSLKNFNHLDVPTYKDKKTKRFVKKQGTEFKIELSEETLQATVKSIVSKGLRSSLRKSVFEPKSGEKIFIPDVIEQLMYATCKGDEYFAEYKKIPRNHIVAMLKVLNADYPKEEQAERIVKSIERKNVKVQPSKEGVLCLSTANHVNEKKEYKSKKYIWKFIKDYACLKNEKKRNEKLLHIRRLIILYFYGEKYYKDENLEVTAWSYGKLKEAGEKYFSEDAVKINDSKVKISSKEKNEKGEAENKQKNAEIRMLIRKEIATRYQEIIANEALLLENEERFWLNWIANEVESVLYQNYYVKNEQLELSYLCKLIWNRWISYVAMKYVDMGKAVYHFATPDFYAVEKETLTFGKLLPEYAQGLTSFDYERIKAKETLERGMSSYIVFATNAFGQAIASEEVRGSKDCEDVLFGDEGKLLKCSYNDSVRRILQYFGGASKWEEIQWKGKKITEEPHKEVIKSFRNALRNVRNSSFHYTARETQGMLEDETIISALFQGEVSGLSSLYVEKYFSNNALMFYSLDGISRHMQNLYMEEDSVVRKVPAFKKVIVRNNMEEIAGVIVGNGEYKTFVSDSKKKGYSDFITKYLSTLYFLLEEIYYHSFICSPECSSMVHEEVKGLSERDKKTQEAVKNFKRRVKEIFDSEDNCSLERLSEHIMTDYNMQNQQKERMASRDVNTQKDKTIYKHFPLLLHQCMRNAFLTYVKKNSAFQFLKKPVVHDDFENQEKAFYERNKDMKVGLYVGLQEEVKKNQRLLDWYAMAHLLSPEYLNKLNGVILSYIQTITDIEKRAAMTGNSVRNHDEEIAFYQKLTMVLSLVRNYAGKISKDVTDYFEGEKEQAEEAYAKYLLNYVAFSEGKGDSLVSDLALFSMERIDKGSPDGKVGIYHDGTNPIIERNIIMTMLYGNVKAVSSCVEKVTLDEIKEFYTLQDELSQVLERGFCTSEEQQAKYKKYQNQKNRIRLLDVKIFAGILNDLYAKLISWSYLRERDLMYLQLGVNYIRLNYGSIPENDFRRKIKGEKVDITDGGVLYQIIAMNTFAIPSFSQDEAGRVGYASDENGRIKRGSAAIMPFIKSYPEAYSIALELFEREKEHTDIIDTRNYFDHFKYYVYADRSMMDMYSEVYDRFFTYDTKLKKSISYIFSDILKGYFVIPYTSVKNPGEAVYHIEVKKDDKKEKVPHTRKAGYITVNKLESDKLTYEIKKKGDSKKISVKVNAREEKFLKQLKKILEYKVKSQ